MKRCWFGFALLGVLLIGCLGAAAETDRFQAPICRALEQAEQAALAEDWDAALLSAGDARARWDRGWRWLAAVTDHAPMEELDSLYAQLEVAGTLRQGDEFASLCAVIRRCTHALADAHRADWWNVL